MGGSTPRVQPPTVQTTPRVTDKANQEAVAEAMRRRSRGRGFRSTILSKDFMDERSAALSETFGS